MEKWGLIVRWGLFCWSGSNIKVVLVCLSMLFLFSCNQKKLNPTNKRLLTFKSTYLADSDDEKFDSILRKNKLNNLEIKYLNDIIYVSYITEVNACSGSNGNIEIKNDSIVLKTFSNSEEVCTSTSVVRNTFIINNYEEKKYNIILN
jgi:hypothetical protein